MTGRRVCNCNIATFSLTVLLISKYSILLFNLLILSYFVHMVIYCFHLPVNDVCCLKGACIMLLMIFDRIMRMAYWSPCSQIYQFYVPLTSCNLIISDLMVPNEIQLSCHRIMHRKLPTCDDFFPGITNLRP